jgi:hypothetical protein
VQVGCTINYDRRGLWKQTEESTRVDYPGNVGENDSSTSLDPELSVPNRGPVAQLGARFHGMEEVVGSIPTRSTNCPPQYSRFYLDPSSVGHGLPDLVNLPISYGDASVRPVLQPVSGSDCAVAVGQSVDEDIASRGNAILPGKGAVMLARIRDVDRLVEPAMRIAEIQNVHAFGCPVISLSGLGSIWITPKGNLVGFDHLAMAEEFERPIFLQHDNFIGMQVRLRTGLRR